MRPPSVFFQQIFHDIKLERSQTIHKTTQKHIQEMSEYTTDGSFTRTANTDVFTLEKRSMVNVCYLGKR